MNRCLPAALLLLSLLFVQSDSFVAQEAPAPDWLRLTEGLALPGVGFAGRSPVYVSSVIADIVQGTFKPPKVGDKAVRHDGTQVEWRKVTAGDDGWISERDMAYLFWTVESDKEQVAILKARGCSSVYVNGESRAGDPYNYGYVELPVLLKEGTNKFLFNTGRGRVKASVEILPENSPTLRIGRDWTLPTAIAQDSDDEVGVRLGAVNVLNLSRKPQAVKCVVSGGMTGSTESGVIEPLSVRKLFFVMVGSARDAGSRELKCRLAVHMMDNGRTERHFDDEVEFTLRLVDQDARRDLTFLSKIDGSVQYYAVRPARPLPDAEDKPGIVLSLHGASVEAHGQAGAYSSKSWCHIVCPTNRRPFGFDWEDWGRLDALEVLAHAQATLENDPTKVWLTGHSMGGHGTLSVGGHFPDRFAAIGPSAGWEDFWSYGGGATHADEHAVSEILNRAANPSRTLLRKHNYSQQGVYILHGDADDNVPVTQARRMRDVLKGFHTDLKYHEEPGVGHWWDKGHDAGADCVDWRPMFDMFARRRLPRINEVQHVDFTTVCPEHSADCHWARIEMQNKQFAPSRVQIELMPNRGVFEGVTDNVLRMSIQVGGVISERETVMINLDETELKVPWPAGGRVFLEFGEAAWKAIEQPAATRKGPHRYGWFKNAFNHNFMYVYGTRGSSDETAAYIAKCRYDQETWWYRGNGGFDVVADKDFDPAEYPARNVILIGNADTNSAWDKLIKDCPLRVGQGRAKVGDRTVEGDDLAMLFIYPRAGTDNNCVGVISGTGVKGIKLTERLGYFVSGASFPDVILYSPEMLHRGTAGVLAAGSFGEDWSLKKGEVEWNETKED